jgi:DNA-binding phage protein
MTRPTTHEAAMTMIRDAIHTQGITPAVLAKRCDLGHDTIYRWLSGQREPKLADLESVLSQIGYRVQLVRDI